VEAKDGGRILNLKKSNPLIELLDRSFNTDITYLIEILSKNFDETFGFNYELESKTSQYYSNVHATVFFNLFLSNLLTSEDIKMLQDALVNLRDNHPSPRFEKIVDDSYAWDVIEGPSCFSTALSCYSLLLTDYNRREDVTQAVLWLLKQRKKKDLWPTHIRGQDGNYVTTFYVILVLLKWMEKMAPREINKMDKIFNEIVKYIEIDFQKKDDYWYIKSTSDNKPCLSNTIIALFILFTLNREKYNKVSEGAKSFIDDTIQNNTNWISSVLSDVEIDGSYKRMYTYNPAYLILLLQMNWLPSDKIIQKMVYWIIGDLKGHWKRGENDTLYHHWKSSDSLIQSFILSLSIHSLIYWVEATLREQYNVINDNMKYLVLGTDVIIIYASEDREKYVSTILYHLEKKGIKVWIDFTGIEIDDPVSDKILSGIDQSKYAIVCFSENYIRKPWPNREYKLLKQMESKQNRRIIIPIMLNSMGKILKKYPELSDYEYIKWEDDINYITDSILNVIKRRDES